MDQLKSQWIMEDFLEPAEIIQRLDKMHHNMVADGSWLNTNEKDTKIVALTLAIQKVNKKFGDLAKKVSFDGSVTAKIEYCVKSILRTCLYIKSILHEIVTM